MNRWNQLHGQLRFIPATCIVVLAMFALGVAQGVVTRHSPTAETSSAPVPENSEMVELTGTVRGADASLCEGAMVWAASHETVVPVRYKTLTNRTGEFRLPLPRGSWRVWAAKGSQGGEPRGTSWTANEFVITPPQKPKAVVIALEERGWLRGQLSLAQSGNPVPNAKLFFNNGQITTTNPKGQWEVGGLTRSPHDVAITAPGCLPAAFRFDTTGKFDTELNLTLSPGKALTFVLQDEKGNPIPGAWMGNRLSEGMFSGQGGFVSPEANGKFAYFTSPITTRVLVGAPGFITQEKKLPGNASSSDGITSFTLTPETTASADQPKTAIRARRKIAGKILLPSGDPAADVFIRYGHSASSDSISTRSDAKGRFQFEVPEKEDFLVVIPVGWLPEVIPLTKGESQSVDIQLSQGASASGTVVDSQGKPIAGVGVLPIVSKPEILNGAPLVLHENSAATDAQGRFTIRGLPENARFHLSKIGFLPLRDYALDLDQPKQTVRLDPVGAIKGRVIGVDGKPVKNFRITVDHPLVRNPNNAGVGIGASYSSLGISFSAEDGSFVVSDLKPGTTWKVQAHAREMGKAMAEAVEAVSIDQLANTTPEVLKAKASVSLQIQITDSDKKPLADADVFLLDGGKRMPKLLDWNYVKRSGGGRTSARSDVNGLVRFDQIAMQDGMALIEAKGFARKKIPWAKGETQLSAALQKEAIILGQIQFPDGFGDHNWYANLTSQNGDFIALGIAENDKGKFVFRGIPEGSWDLEIGNHGPVIGAVSTARAFKNQTVELKAGQVLQWKWAYVP